MRTIFQAIKKEREVKVSNIRSMPIYQKFVALENKENFSEEEIGTLKEIIKCLVGLLEFEDEIARKRIGVQGVIYMKKNSVNLFFDKLARLCEVMESRIRFARKFKEKQDWKFATEVAHKIIRQLERNKMLKT